MDLGEARQPVDLNCSNALALLSVATAELVDEPGVLPNPVAAGSHVDLLDFAKEFHAASSAG